MYAGCALLDIPLHTVRGLHWLCIAWDSTNSPPTRKLVWDIFCHLKITILPKEAAIVVKYCFESWTSVPLWTFATWKWHSLFCPSGTLCVPSKLFSDHANIWYLDSVRYFSFVHPGGCYWDEQKNLITRILHDQPHRLKTRSLVAQRYFFLHSSVPDQYNSQSNII